MISLISSKALPASAVVAEIAASFMPPELTPLINIGAIGCILAWFLVKLEPRLRKLEESQDRATRMQGFVIIALKSVHPAVREQVEQVIREVEDAEAARKK